MARSAVLTFTVMSVLVKSSQQVCVDNTKECTFRYELQFDFKNEFQLNCTSVFNSCICLKPIELVYLPFLPYIGYHNESKSMKGLLKGMLNEAIKLCCFGCNRITYKKPINSLGEMFNAGVIQHKYTAIFPILATKTIKEYFAGPFISMISTPGVSYVANYDEVEESLTHMMDAISKTWQLLVLSILMSLNAGFVVWILDTRKNEIDFPRAFPQGAIEGGWWAFVSMTTVGYGDRCPRSLISRSFAVIWILFGIAISGMFTASLTSALTSSFSSTTIDLGKKKVGVLNTTRYEHNIALREGAIPVEFVKIEDMKAALKAQTVKGLLIDNNVLGYNWAYLKSGMTLSVNGNIKNSDTTYGIMFDTNFVSNETRIINKRWATFLSTFFDYNKDNENIMLSAARKNLDKEISHEPFKKPTSSSGFSPSTYMLFFKAIGVTSSVLILCGILYEIVRRSFIKNKAFSCSTNGLKISDVRQNAKSKEIEMSNLEDKAENLIRDLEKILTDMKAVKRKTSRVEIKM